MSGATLTSVSSFVQGRVNTTSFSLGSVHSADSIETWRVHYVANVTSSARTQAELSIQPSLHWINPTSLSPYEVWVGVAGSSGSVSFLFLYQAWPWLVSVLTRTTPTCLWFHIYGINSHLCHLVHHMRSTPYLTIFPNVAIETVPLFAWLTMALFRPFKEDRLAFPLSTPLFSRRSMVWCPRLCARR